MNKSKAKRNKFWRPKGRELDSQAVNEIDSLLADQVPQREMLIEFLHQIQGQYGCLHVSHLHALASWMNIAPVEVYEVATFYHHFDVIDEGETPPPEITIRVCDSISCMLSGAEKLIRDLEVNQSLNGLRIQRVPCVGRCDTAPVAVVGQQPVACATSQRIAQVVEAKQYACPALPEALDTYLKEGGYDFYRACLAGEHEAGHLRRRTCAV
jgi:formate dehydrogenase